MIGRRADVRGEIPIEGYQLGMQLDGRARAARPLPTGGLHLQKRLEFGPHLGGTRRIRETHVRQLTQAPTTIAELAAKA